MLSRRHSSRTVLAAAAGAAAAVLLSAEVSAQETSARPRLRPSISADAPIIPLPPPRPTIPTPSEIAGEPPAPSACQLRLISDVAVVDPVPHIAGANGCGVEDPVRLSAVMTKEKVRVAITPPAIMRCMTAEAIVHWIRDDVAPIAATLGAPLGGIANFASYECRGRNRIAGAKMSEHGKGNAIDIRAITLANGKSHELTDVTVAKEVREKLRASACARFTTVLGPASDGFHENHIHVDLAERRSGYRICQWAVRDSNDLVPLPRERPAEAPPREAE